MERRKSLRDALQKIQVHRPQPAPIHIGLRLSQAKIYRLVCSNMQKRRRKQLGQLPKPGLDQSD